MFRAIIFDFDGVILDSVDIKTKAFARLFEEHGETVVRQVVEYHLEHCGVSRFRKFKHFHENILRIPFTDADSERLGGQFSDLVFDEVVKAAWIPGAAEFLQQNHARYLIFVASGTPQEELERIVQLRGLGKFFVSVHGSPTTKEKITAEILQRHGLSKSEVIFVGDAMTDYDAAKVAGVAFTGVVVGASNPFPAGTGVVADLRELENNLAAPC